MNFEIVRSVRTFAHCDLHAALVASASREADRYWGRRLWGKRPPSGAPDGALLQQLAIKYRVEERTLTLEWWQWYNLLTSWDYLEAMTGVSPGRYRDHVSATRRQV